MPKKIAMVFFVLDSAWSTLFHVYKVWFVARRVGVASNGCPRASQLT